VKAFVCERSDGFAKIIARAVADADEPGDIRLIDGGLSGFCL